MCTRTQLRPLRLGILALCLLVAGQAGASGNPYRLSIPRADYRLATGDKYRWRDPAVADALRVRPFSSAIDRAASASGIDPVLLHAVVEAESAYRPGAVSPKGAQGLMQLMPATARRFGVRDAFDPTANAAGGARYLAELMRLFDGDVALALAAYNAGEGSVMRYGRRIPPYAETVGYVAKVMHSERRLRRDVAAAKSSPYRLRTTSALERPEPVRSGRAASRDSAPTKSYPSSGL